MLDLYENCAAGLPVVRTENCFCSFRIMTVAEKFIDQYTKVYEREIFLIIISVLFVYT